MDASSAEVLFLIDGGVDEYHPTAVRASMGALFWKPVVRAEFSELQRFAQVRTYRLIGATAHAEPRTDPGTIQVPWILVLGSEQKGLSTDQMSACDALVSISMKGRVSSLNLAVAAGILMYQLP